MFKFLFKTGKFLAECTKAAAHGMDSINNELDKLNCSLQAHNEWRDSILPIHTASHISGINKIKIKRLLRSSHFMSSEANLILKRSFEFYSSVEVFCTKALSSKELTGKVVSSSHFMDKLSSIEKLNFEKDGLINYISECHKGRYSDCFIMQIGSEFEVLNNFVLEEHAEIKEMNVTAYEFVKLQYLLKPLLGRVDHIIEIKSKLDIFFGHFDNKISNSIALRLPDIVYDSSKNAHKRKKLGS
uniref:hypothetical protein n=1 Tax=Rheinheimera sp. TaxID=1869214 RepID=UPI0040479664